MYRPFTRRTHIALKRGSRRSIRLARYLGALAWTCVSLLCTLLIMSLFSGWVHAQTATKPPVTSNTGPSVEAAPKWQKLTPSQQQTLAPLANDWPALDSARKKKWLIVAQKYQTMPPAEQQRMHSRMQTWAQLSPAQRQAARDNYAQAISSPKAVPLESGKQSNLSEQWAKYQALPPEKRAALQAQAEKPSTTEKHKPLAKP